jgi:hypothetical protein
VATKPYVVGEPFSPFRLFEGVFLCEAVARHVSISAAEKLCYARLCKYAGKGTTAWPKQETLAEDLGVSVRQAHAYLQRLESESFIRSKRRGLGMSNEYEILWHPCFECDENDIATSDPDRNNPADPDRQPSSSTDTRDPSDPIEEVNQGSESEEEESSLPPLSEVSTEAMPKLLVRWSGECSAKLPRYSVKEITLRDKRAQSQGAEEAIDYRERLRAACAEYREDPSGLALGDRLKAVRFASAGSYRNGGGSGYTPPPKPVSTPEKRLRADLENRGCDFAGCGPTAEWVVNEVLGFQARYPEMFNTKILPAAIVSAGGMGSTVITLCHAQIRERGGKGETASEMIDRL